jgi:hypothetical protein
MIALLALIVGVLIGHFGNYWIDQFILKVSRWLKK